MHTHASGSDPAGVVSLTAMWFGMMTLMMAPTVWPWVRAFSRFSGVDDSRIGRVCGSAVFFSGYATAWLFYAAAAAVLQSLLLQASAFDPVQGALPLVGAAILAGAGLFQFAPLKRACLLHCRNPMSYFLARWRDGMAGGFQMGFGHGLFCVGCCWAVMATALAVGVMNWWWMLALTAAAFVEQVVPHGDRLRVPLGMGLIGASITRLI